MEGVLQHEPIHKTLDKVYRLAAGKRTNTTQMTTLRKADGSLTAELKETLKHMFEQFAPEDNHNDVSDTHKQARFLFGETVDTEDDKDFTEGEIRNALASIWNKKAAGEDGITREIYVSAFDMLPNYITAFYNGCLRRGFSQSDGRKRNSSP